MSDFQKKLHQYRQGDNWRENFKSIDVHNVEASLRSILTKQEKPKIYDRLGNHTANGNYPKPLSLDETIFRIMVLMDTQLIRPDDYENAMAESVAFVGKKPPAKFGGQV